MTDLDVFAYTAHPDESLFYQRNDPYDPRLGEIVRSNRAAYGTSRTVILGVPQDEGVRRRHARSGAAEAPDAIRRWLYQLSVSNLTDDPNFNLFDLGNLHIQPTLEETHTALEALVDQVLRDGKTLIVLGGGGDISYPDGKTLAKHSESMLAISVDAHFDVREERRISCGTAFRQLIEGDFIPAENYYTMGYQVVANSPIYAQYLRDKGANLYSLNELREKGTITTFRDVLIKAPADTLFWSFDLDVVRSGDAPGVSAPNPLGFTGEEFCQITHLAGTDERTRLVEFVEVNPKHDVADRTSHLTAVAIFQFLSGMSQRG